MRELNEKTKGLLSVGAVVLLAVFMLIFVSVSLKDKDKSPKEELTVDTEQPKESEDLLIISDTSKSEVQFEGVLLFEITKDFTNDGNDDLLSACFVGVNEDSSKVEEGLKDKSGYLNFILQDTTKGEILYNKKVSNDNGFRGELSIVNYGDGGALLEGSILPTTGKTTYSFEVFNFKDGKKNVLDSYQAAYVTTPETALNEFKNGNAIHSVLEIEPDFRESLEKYYAGSVLLAVCEKSSDGKNWVLYTTKDKTLTMKDYYDNIWNSNDELGEYVVSEVPNLLGGKAFCVKEDLSLYSMNVFYYFYNEKGTLLAKTFGENYYLDCDGDGTNELITNAVYSDGAQYVIVYANRNGKIQQAYATDMLSSSERNVEEIWTEYAIYNPDTKQVEIYEYSDDIGDFKSYKKKIDLSKLIFTDPIF